jgi:hypothetical protein
MIPNANSETCRIPFSALGNSDSLYLILKGGIRMSKFKYVPPHQLGPEHIGKPTKLVLKNGKTMYGTIKEIHKNGILFIHADKGTHSSLFFPFFFPFGFFIPFIIF